MNDEEQREADAFYVAEREKLFNYTRGQGFSIHDAEDIVIHSFLGLFERWGEHINDRRGYLYRTARNEMIRLRRDRARMPEDPLEDESCAVTADFASQFVDNQTLRWALGKIPMREREAVALRHWDEHDVTGAALKMGCARGAVMRYTYDGRARLRSLLDGTPATPGESG